MHSSQPIFSPQADPAPGVLELQTTHKRVTEELAKVIVGMRDVVELTLIAIYAGGHVLLEGSPGLAKTTLAKNISQVLGLEFRRVQFAPDLMPSDILGAQVWKQESSTFEYRPGPIFTNILMADEINRTPPKTQSALLEAMQEKQVTIDGTAYPLPAPFIVIATQNQIGTHGTFPLPAAQLDRFMMRIKVAPPSARELVQIVNMPQLEVSPVLSPTESSRILRSFQSVVDQVLVPEVLQLRIAEKLLSINPESPSFDDSNCLRSAPLVRGMQSLIRCAKAAAVINNDREVTPDHIRRVAYSTLEHRMIFDDFAGSSEDSQEFVADLFSDL